MLRRVLATLAILTPLVACSPANQSDSVPAESAAPAASAPAAEVAASAPATAAGTSAPAATASAPTAASAPSAAATPPATPVAATAPDEANAPRLGTDYFVLSPPQPQYAPATGKIEVAEVFSYACVHCAQFQPTANAWLKSKPADVHWEYVPGVFGGIWDNFARAYFAAEILGVRERTHDDIFKAVHIDHTITSGSLEEIADLYAKFGADRAKFLDTENSFGVTAKLNRAKQFALRTGVSATPTIIIDGKYRVMVTPDRGFEGMLKTVDYLIAHERAGTVPAATANGATGN